ncbi:hypothetical protein DMENIID0001_164480 [Sergentomyia squamirostris]
MKFIVGITFAAILVASAYGQGPVQQAVDILVPCATAAKINPDSIKALLNGDLSALSDVPQLIGCFSDCVSKKLGFVSDDNVFQKDNFRSLIIKYLNPDIEPSLSAACGAATTQEECKASAGLYVCIVEHALTTIFS